MKTEIKILISILLLFLLMFIGETIYIKLNLQNYSKYKDFCIFGFWLIIIILLYYHDNSKLEKKIQLINSENLTKQIHQKEYQDNELNRLQAEIEFLKNKNNTQEKFLTEEYNRKLKEFIEKNKSYINISDEFKSYNISLQKKILENLYENNIQSIFHNLNIELSKINSVTKLQFSDIYLYSKIIDFIKTREYIEIYSDNIELIDKYSIFGKYVAINIFEEIEKEVLIKLSKNPDFKGEINFKDQKNTFDVIITNHSELILPFDNLYIYILNPELASKFSSYYVTRRTIKSEDIIKKISESHNNLPF